MQKLVILGCGFVGKYLIEELKNDYEVFATSRNPQVNLNNFENSITFDLNNSDTYKNLPENSMIIWNFPAEPLEKVQDFYQYCLAHLITIKIIYGSTSAYIKKQGNINENDLTDESIQRVKGENFLLNNGVNILQLSGIYGESKSPFNWLNKGLIKNSNKNVNLIHVKDIVKITKNILSLDLKSQRINVTDGHNYLWKDLWKSGQDRNVVNVDCPPFLEANHRYIENNKLLNIIGNYQFENI